MSARLARCCAPLAMFAVIGAASAEQATPLERIDQALAPDQGVVGIVVLVRHDGQADWSHPAGHRFKGGPAVVDRDEFRIASVTKTFVAAALLRLVETGKLKLSDPISERLSSTTNALLVDGGYQTERITVRDLLSHRAGLRDYGTAPRFAQAVMADPGHVWTRAEQIGMTVALGGPLSKTGTAYVYSDAGYVLIGEIIERGTGRSLGAVVPDLLRFDRLGLHHTYWEQVPPGRLENVPETRIHAFEDGFDTAAFNPSFDLYGGGGLISTANDLLIFYRALLSGGVFDKPSTLAVMKAPAKLPIPAAEGDGYGLGIERIAVPGSICWGHKGHWGTIATWCPDLRAGFVVSTNAAGEPAYRHAGNVVDAAVEVMIAKR